MKIPKLLASFVVFAFITTMYASMSLAANKYIGVQWFNQPDAAAGDKYWKEMPDGSFESILLGANGTSTIAYVPTGYTAGADSKKMVKDFDVTVDLTVPDQSEFPDSWAGFYIRASAPQTGTNGYVIHMNADGLAVLDGESGTPLIDERIRPELFKANDWNRVRVTLIEKEMKIWVNGQEIYTYKNCMVGAGYLGLTCINYKAKYRNYKLIADGTKNFEAFMVPGTEAPIIVESSSVAVSSKAPSSISVTTAGTTSSKASSAASTTEKTDSSSDMTILIIIIAAVVVIGGGVAGYLIAKKKKAL